MAQVPGNDAAMSPAHARVRTSVRPWAWLSVLLAAVAVACLVASVRTSGPTAPRSAVADPEPVTSSAASAPSTSSIPSAPEAGSPRVAAPASPPVGLRIPAIDVDATVIRLGLNEDRTVEVPTDAADTGWYRLGPPPGARGSAVVLGHVDSVHGPGVFFRLRFLEPGDLVLVDAADGSTSTFRVLRLATYPNEDFPARQVYTSPGSDRLLNLVTCGGDYDPESGYQANVVVYTRMVRGA